MPAENTNAGGGEPVTILYTNWRGETAVRQIVPGHEDHARKPFWIGSTAWHQDRQWLVTAMDVEKGERRDFALSGIKAWGQEAVDAALSAQSTGSAGVAAEPVAWDELNQLFAQIPAGPWQDMRSTGGHEIRQIDTDPTNKHHWPFRLCQSVSGQLAACDDAVFAFIAGVLNAWPYIAFRSSDLDAEDTTAPTPPTGGGETLQADLCELLTILGMGNYARPQSPHEVFQHALSFLKGRLALADEAFATLRALYDAASEGAFVPEEPMDRADRLFSWERSFREDWLAEDE